MSSNGTSRQNICTIDGCNRLIRAQSYCPLHYRKYIFLPSHPLYHIWRAMLHSGVPVYERWKHSYWDFVTDIGLRPSPRHRFSRIDNKLGYAPENCQWTTPIGNSLNRNQHRITGVYYQSRTKKYHATITINRRRHHLGLYKDLEEAINARALAEARYTVG